ncbi:MAG: hypothetical protein ACRDSP_14010 [Pseudonocardiaceae bacterium]
MTTTTTDTETVPTTAATTLAELVAEQLCSSHIVDGHYTQLAATACGDDVTLTLTRWELDVEDDVSARVLLHLEPIAAPGGEAEVVEVPAASELVKLVDVDVADAPAAAQTGAEIGASA